MANRPFITVAEGDGIGPEIMAATLRVLEAAGANLAIQKVEIGEKVYLQGEMTGIAPQTWELIRKSDAFLKAPITTPQGGGYKSLNVSIRTKLGLYANIRHSRALFPFVPTKHPGMDLVIVRENEEDLYAGIEYRHTQDHYQALKVITEPGCEKIIRYAFEYAKSHDRKKVTCFTKDNILKLTDGEFHKVFERVGAEYPEIEQEHWIIDIGTAKLADTPNAFDVIVMPNLYGDILSDVAAQIAGSVGMAGSANIGTGGAMFEAIHGSAPRRAGQNVANPSGLLLAAVLMLVHVHQPEIAANIHNAWLTTIEDGIHTYDIFHGETSKMKVGTKEFADAIIARLGQMPKQLTPVHYSDPKTVKEAYKYRELNVKKELLGLDIYLDWRGDTEKLAAELQQLSHKNTILAGIYNRGVQVWPNPLPETFYTDCWRCRFLSESTPMRQEESIKLLTALHEAGFSLTQTQYLFSFDGVPAYSGA